MEELTYDKINDASKIAAESLLQTSSYVKLYEGCKNISIIISVFYY
jgi:hypothetical protein